MDTFDLLGPLPEKGTTLLEASAGTGKTYTIGALVVRYVAEGVASLDQMLVITFGRAASQELRERVRQALVEAERALADPAADPGDDRVLAHLLDASEAERAARRERLSAALSTFDAATIATTHQFCQLVLRSLGVAGDTDAAATLVETLDELVVEVVDDQYLRRYGQRDVPPPFGRDRALDVARSAVEDPQAALAPADPADPAGSERVWFATAVRAEVERRKRRLGILSYDDLLARLASALGPAGSPDADRPARARMRQRWRIVLVDEFQDTDPVQWQVLDRAFTGHATMVLVGDPKQAIYAFRGGDVVTYLAAARTAGTHATLGTNWRSDAALVDRLQLVLRGAALGHPEIVVREVVAHHEGSRLVGAPHPAPFRLRQVTRQGFKLAKGLVRVDDARERIAADCAADVAELLASGATWDGEPLEARHVAVIVAVRTHGALVQRALAERGVPAVMAGGGDVFQTPAADDWLALLEGLESPHRTGLVRTAALTCFFGKSATELDGEGEAATAQVADTLRGWALLLRRRGVAALVEAGEERGLTSRTLGRADGERLLTDVRHLGQLLHEAAVRDGMGLTALLGWFRDERRRTAALERPRRLDSDAAAVQILTVHGSKGLQFPVVYLPFAYDNYVRLPDVARFHAPVDAEVADEAAADEAPPQRTLDVAGSGAAWDDHVARHRTEELGEELRDLYVALTRAQSQVVAWWAPTANTAAGGLHRILFGRQPGTAAVPDTQAVRDDSYATRILGLIEQLDGPAAELATPVPRVPAPARPSTPTLAARAFDRAIDTEWRRTSYSGLIQAADGGVAHVASEPEVPGTDDEPDTGAEGAAAIAEVPPDSPVSPLADLPVGATFGSLVHAVLEHADPADLEAELARHVTEQLRWWRVAADAETLATALVPLNRTSLGPLAGGVTLGEIPLRDRLRELDFELPLAGGDVRASTGSTGERPDVRLRDVAPLLRAHLPVGDPLAPFAQQLEEPALGDQALRGYLTGSVDAVLRLPDGRYLVVDYKTNHLGPTAADYAPDRLAEAMLHTHYPLQALLYSAVVHRFLRWRLPGYDPETHLGGVLYLFVRGMCGPQTPEVDGHPAGVFSWRPPGAQVTDLSDLLDGRNR